MPKLIRTYNFSDQIVRAQGSFLYKSDGTRLLDGSAGIWNTILGHGREDIIRSIEEQLRSLTYLPIVHSRSPRANELAECLLKRAPRNMNHVMLHCTGTSAVESAALLARHYFRLIGQGQRVGIITVDRSFHGGSFLGLNLSGYPEESESFQPKPGGLHQIATPDGEVASHNSIDDLVHLIETAGADSLAAFIFEPIMAVAGVIVPPDWWTEKVLSLCRNAGIKIIADEVTTGLGRTGSWFACSKEPVDMIAIGKGLSAGYMPIAASLYSHDMFEPFDRESGVMIDFGSTMDGHPAACASAIAVIHALEQENLIQRSAEIGTRLLSRLKPLEQLPIVKEVSGRGLMIGIRLVESGKDDQPMRRSDLEKTIRLLMDAGLLLHHGQSTLTVFPPLTINEEEVDVLVSVLDEVLHKLSKELTTRH